MYQRIDRDSLATTKTIKLNAIFQAKALYRELLVRIILIVKVATQSFNTFAFCYPVATLFVSHL